MSDILDYYVKLVKFLGLALGSHCEVILQDCRKVGPCVIAIANNNVSGRKIGAPLTDYCLSVIASKRWQTQDWEINYTGHTADGKTLMCSTFYIKDKDRLLGMLCLNYDPSEYVRLSNDILKLGGIFQETQPGNEFFEDKISPVSPVENFYKTIPDMIQAAVKEISGNINVDIKRLNQKERVSVIARLNEMGIFQIKGAVSEIARSLDCSEASIYRYLSKLSKRT